MAVTSQAALSYPGGKCEVKTLTWRSTKRTATRRRRAIQRSMATRSDTSLRHPREGPAGVLAQVVVLMLEIRLDCRPLRRAADVAGGHEGVALQPASVVPRHVEPVVAAAQVVGLGAEPLDERDVR